MAIGKKNSGFFKQDAVMGKLSADARKPYKVNAVVAQALEQGKRRKAYLEERAKNHVPRFVKQYSVSLNGPGSDVRAFLGKKQRDMKSLLKKTIAMRDQYNSNKLKGRPTALNVRLSSPSSGTYPFLKRLG